MRIMVTGGAGYIGSVLVRELARMGYSVICLDRLFFGSNSISDLLELPNFTLLREDVRSFSAHILKDIDVVIDLAALSNDPSGDIDPTKTFDINYLGRSRVARLSKQYGVRRYILASSCSLYGFQEGELNESSGLNPLTNYAKANRLAEEDVLPLGDSDFTVTCLRFATIYGSSYRMRFDLAINSMVLSLFKKSKIPVMRNGEQWRPFLHVRDAVEAYILFINQPSDIINGEIYNVGSTSQNYQVLALAEMIGNSLGLDYEIEWYGSPDYRSYKVDFSKFENLTGFRPKRTPIEAAKEVYVGLKQGSLSDEMKTRTVEWYKYLVECYKVTSELSLRGTML